MQVLFTKDPATEITNLYLVEGLNNEYVRNWYWKDNQLLKRKLLNSPNVSSEFIALLSLPNNLFNKLLNGIEKILNDAGRSTPGEIQLRKDLMQKQEQIKLLETLYLKALGMIEGMIASMESGFLSSNNEFLCQKSK